MRLRSKKHIIGFLMLLYFLQGVDLCAENQYEDSLLQVVQSTADVNDRHHASVLLARSLLPAYSDSARTLLENAAGLDESNLALHRADYYNGWGLYYWYRRDRQAAIRYYTQTLHLMAHPSIFAQQGEAANHTGLLYYQLGIADSSRVYLYKALDIDRQRDHHEGVAKTLYDLSRLHRMQNQYELAYTYITEAIHYQEEFGTRSILHFFYNVLGNTHAALGEKKLAAEAYNDALAHALDAGIAKEEVVFYNNMAALWCEEEGMLDQTLVYVEQGLPLAHDGGYDDLVASLLTNKGQAWLTADSPSRALELFDQAMTYIEELNSTRMEMDVRHRIGKAYKAREDFWAARQAQLNTLELAEQLGSVGFQSDALLQIAALDSLQGNYGDFARHYVQGVALRDSVWNRDNRSRIAELKIIHETEQKELEIAQLRQQEEVRRFRMTAVGAGSGLVFFLLLLVILYLRKRQLLLRQQYQMKQQQAESRLEANRRELTGKALSLARSEKLIKQLKKDIKGMMESSGENNDKGLQSVLRLLKSEDNSQQLWKEFETRFNELNEGFISRLTARYPTLSPAEIRLCAMLRLQMSTKEIAEMINRSTRTIDFTRHSVRKKMALTPGDNLVQHLLQV